MIALVCSFIRNRNCNRCVDEYLILAETENTQNSNLHKKADFLSLQFLKIQGTKVEKEAWLISLVIFLELFHVKYSVSVLFEFLFRDPHLLERTKVRDNASSHPTCVDSVRRSEHRELRLIRTHLDRKCDE